MPHSVSFHRSVTVVEVQNSSDFTRREIADVWYSSDEMDQITKRCFKVVRKMDAREAKRYCTRGLEGYSRIGSVVKTMARSTALAAVLNEQSRHSLKNEKFDDQAIANVYQRISSSCRLWAQVVGKQDRQTANAIYYQTNEKGDDNDLHDLILRVEATRQAKFSTFTNSSWCHHQNYNHGPCDCWSSSVGSIPNSVFFFVDD